MITLWSVNIEFAPFPNLCTRTSNFFFSSYLRLEYGAMPDMVQFQTVIRKGGPLDPGVGLMMPVLELGGLKLKTQMLN